MSSVSTTVRLRYERLCVVGLLLIHAGLLAWPAYTKSPVYDEVAHLPAGISHWQFGRFELYRANPPLVRMIAAAPVLLADPQTDWSGYYESPGARPTFDVGADFVTANGRRAFWLYTLGRWALIPVCLIGGYVCYRWARELYGPAAGLVALSLWSFSPDVIGNGALITPDAGATAFGVLAAYTFHRWLNEPHWDWALAAGVTLGFAQLAKMTWVILFALWPLIWITWITTTPKHKTRHQSNPPPPPSSIHHPPSTNPPTSWHKQLTQLTTITLLALYFLNAVYAFDGSFKQLGDYQFVSSTLTGKDYTRDPGNRFENTLLAAVPVPLPEQYVLGVDITKAAFDARYPSYLRGELRDQGWWYYYLYGLAIKVPLGTWLLAAVAAWVGFIKARSTDVLVRTTGPNAPQSDESPETLKGVDGRRRPSYRTKAYTPGLRNHLVLITPLCVLLIFVSANTGINRHVRYMLPVYPFAFILISGAARAIQSKRWKPVAIGAAALAWSTVASLWYWPHSGSCFNELVGGPANGWKHLNTSNIDWGQDALYLKAWLDRHPEARPLHFAFYGNFDPHAAGIEFQPVPVGPQVQEAARPDLGKTNVPPPGWYAVSVHLLSGARARTWSPDGKPVYTPENAYIHFRNRKPVARAGWSINIYRVTGDG